IYETNYRVMLEGKTAICVDYDGDTEVLCEVAYLNDSLGRTYLVEAGRLAQRSRFETQCDGKVVAAESENSERAEIHDELWMPGNGMRTLRVGSLEVPLTGDERANGLDMTVDYFRSGDVQLAPIGSISQYQSSRHVRGRLLYIDARNQTVVYESEESRILQDAS